MQEQRLMNLLIVEDSPEDRTAIRRYLLQDQSSRFILHEAKSGKEGLACCQILPLDCVLLDYNLPDMFGTVFLERLRIQLKQPFVPVIILTGSGSELIAVQAMKGGAQDYLLKDQCTSELLSHTITNAIEKMAMQRQLAEQHLELEQQRHAFSMLVENAPDIIARFDSAFRYQYINPALTRATGLLVENFLGKTNQELGMPEELTALVDKGLALVFATGKSGQIEYELPSPAGTYRYFQTRLAPEFGSDGEVISVLGVSRDITEVKQTEIDLREREQRYRVMGETVPYGVWMHDSENGLQYISQSFLALIGMTLEECKERGWFHLVPPDEAEAVRMAWLHSQKTGQMWEQQYQVRGVDGQLHSILSRGLPIHDQQGVRKRWVGVHLDMDERKRVEDALRESEERLRLAFSAARMGTWDWDISTGKLHWSESMEALLGLKPGTFGGTFAAFEALVYPDDLPRVQLLVQQALDQRVEYQAEFRMCRLDGSICWVIARGTVLYDDEDRPIRVIGVDLDITERRLAEQQATERANELEGIFEAISDGLLLLDTHGHAVRLNRAAREFLGVSTGSLNERLFISPFPFVNEQGQPLLPAQQPEARLIQGENLSGVNAIDVRLRRDHGREMELSVTGTPLSTEDGGISGAIMIAHDVTARRKLERRTHAALDALLVMAESLVSSEVSAQPGETSQVVMQHLAELTSRVLDGEGAVMVVLAAGTDKIEDVVSTGFDEALESALQARLQGKLLAECLHDPDLVRPLREGHAYSLDMRKSPYQELRPLDHLELALFIPLRLRNDLVGVLTLYPTDPGRLYLAEEITLAEAVGKLVALVIERERLLREREEARASSLAARETTQRMDEFVGIVSHELKTPLTSLRGNLQLAKRYLKRNLPTEDDVEDQSVEIIKLVLSLLDRAEQQLMAQNRLVNDLVDVTRIQIDKLELQIARCDLNHLVQEIIDDQRSLIVTRTILFEPPVEEITVLADAQRVGQVVNNYLSNALKYSDKEKPVLVQIEMLESAVQVSVHDEGPGISLEAQQRIWERFYRVPGIEVRSGVGVGLGLGLHICRTIIERQGGAVGVESVQGQGSTFWFTLPYAESLKTPEEYSSGVNN